jgi:rhodanese-related sulfurtransferase
MWWADAQAKADRDGYRLISFEALEELLMSGRDFILIDARTRYEYEAGHLTGSVWMEFFPGEDQALAPGKAEALKRRIGPNLDRPVVTVCRNYA